MSNPKFHQVANSGFRVLPLFPDETPQSAHDPDLQAFEERSGFCKPKIVPPSPEVQIQVINHLSQAFTPLSTGQIPDLVFETLYAFGMNPDL